MKVLSSRRLLSRIAFGAVSMIALSTGLTACSNDVANGQTDNKLSGKTAETIRMAPTPISSQGMVVAANPLAVEAGIDILKEGGSAVDAAIAVQAVLGLVEPQSSGLGGGAFMVVYDSQNGDVWTYDGRETAPSTIGTDLFLGDDGEPIRRFDGVASGLSTGVPGAVVMLEMAHQDYGHINWGPHFEPALRLAEQGFEISPRMAGMMARMGRFFLKDQEAAREYFFEADGTTCLLYTSPSPRDQRGSRMPSSA